MTIGIDPRILFGGRGVSLPDPADVARQQLVNEGLVDARRRRQLEDEAKAQLAEQARMLQSALPAVLQSGFSDESIMRADPRVQGALLKMQGEVLKQRGEQRKTAAEAGDKEAQTKGRVIGWIGGNAYEMSNRRDLTPDDVGAFVQHARALGADVSSLGGMPTDTSPAGLAAYMRRIANMSVGAADQIKFAGEAADRSERGRHNRATEENTVRGQNMTDARSREANAAAAGNAALLMQGQPQEITVDGKPVLAIYDRRTGTFFDANSRQPVRGGIAPKEPDMPATLREKMAQNEVTISKIGRALSLVDQYPDAFGAKNYAPDAIIQRIDPKGVEVRALVSDIAGQRIHDRSGAAVTVGEMARLRPYIPNVQDAPGVVREKLGLLQREYEAIQSEIAAGRSLADMVRGRQAGGGQDYAAGREAGGKIGNSKLRPEADGSFTYVPR